METFKVKVSSWVAFIFTLAIVLFIGIKLLPQKQPPTLAIIYASTAMTAALFATRVTSRALVEFTVSEDTIQLIWLKQFLFQKNKDLTFKWTDVQTYKYQQDRNFDLFNIELKDGAVIKLWHSNGFVKDDFMKFRLYFEKRVQLFNQEELKGNLTQNENATKIIKEKTFYQTKAGLSIAIALGLLAIITPIIIHAIPHENHGNFGMVILASFILMIGSILYFLKYFQK